MSDMEWYDWIAIGLLVIGGLNWGSIGALGINFVQNIAGNFQNWIYVLVGIAAIYSPFRLALS